MNYQIAIFEALTKEASTMIDANPMTENPKTAESFQNEMFPEVGSNPNNSDQNKTSETDSLDGQKSSEIVPKQGNDSKRRTQIKKAKGRKLEKAAQPKKIKTEDMVKWSIFVQEETKTAIGKAVDKAGVSVTEWVDTRLRKAANDELLKKPQPPAKVEDVADIIKGFAETMQASQQAAQEAQGQQIKEQGEQIAALTAAIRDNQPKGIRELLFGRKKEG